MLTAERHRLIRDLLKKQDIVNIQELMELTEASESTIRRDLTQLEHAKFLKRIHGGAARLQGKLDEQSVVEKSAKNLQTKMAIAKLAASFVEDGDCIYLDAGTTVYQMIPYLQQKKIVVVTNSVHHLDALIVGGIKTYLVGGEIKYTTKAMIGRGAFSSLQQYRFDKCFMGMNGIHATYGYTTPDPEEAMIKQAAIHLSREAYILADESKFNEVSFAEVAALHEATILTNAIEASTLKALKTKTTVKVVTG
ncbi:DeoR/GlpR family DNA-binding transcription regulator [Lysinibacillus piscis]|uniref:DeoR family transcriptional regulator n=1 Tax=Lysinibacillus piscis TaxID=2518931 RepID=A0ABQ5NLW3_9BACI|nr:DeoR/GlpR family DNA-binding transcription regulator [Lysinibacillus sp. KH24]GLC89240.1 DeoR family transcriptional regulator [Lysinibacillus sp. KH24]